MKAILVCLLLSANVFGSEVIDLTYRDGQTGPVTGLYPSGSPVVAEYSNMQYPESTHFDETNNLLFISNINGPGLAKDGNGWIARVSTEPLSKEATPWVKGLNAPKGLSSFKGTLWIADIDELVGVDIKTGNIAKRITIPGARLLNDVVIDEKGTIYVSDTFTSSIHKVENGKVSLFDSGEHLNSPNGLYLENDSLIVSAYGLTQGRWVTPVPGSLYSLNLKSKKKTDLLSRKNFKVLDGLQKFDGDNYLFTEGPAGIVHVGNVKTGSSRPLVTGVWGAADIGYSKTKKLLAIPRLDEDRVIVIKMEGLGWKEAQGKAAVPKDHELEQGRIKASVGFCIACHGQSDTAFLPIINGQKEDYIIKALKDFRSGERQNPLMNPPASQLKDREIKYLAKFFSTKKNVSKGTPPFGAGKKLSESCIGCHGDKGIGLEETWPNLAGQRKVYLIKTLTDFKTGHRKNEIMKSIVDELTESNIKDLAEYYSNL